MVGIRGAVPILCAALAACSAGEAREEAVRPSATVSVTTTGEASPLAGDAVLTLDELEAAPPSRQPLRAGEGSVPEPPPLSPELADLLLRGPGGMGMDPLEDLTIAFEEQPGDEIPLVLGDTSVLDEGSLPSEALDPVPAALEDGLH